MRNWRWLVLILLAVLALSAAAAALFGPGLLRSRAQSWVLAETGRVLSIGEISLNPLTLTLEVRDLALSETDRATPLVAWRRLAVQLSPRSLWHRAPVIRALQLEEPALRIERLADGSFNFTSLLNKESAEEQRPAEGGAAHFSLNNLTISGGRLEFIDRTLAEPVVHRVEDLALALPFVGNLPYLAERYVQPHLSALVNGSPFTLDGRLKPFADTPEYGLTLQVAALDLPYYFGYLPATLPVRVVGGELAVDLELGYRAAADRAPQLELAGRLTLKGLDLRDHSGRQPLYLPALELDLAPSRPLERHLHLTGLAIHSPHLWLDRDAAGQWSFARLLPAPAADQPPDRQAEDTAAPWQLRIDRLALSNGRLALNDRLPPGGFVTALRHLQLELTGLELAAEQPAQLALSLESERGEQLTVTGQLTPQPLTVDLLAEVQGVPLAAYQPYFRELMAIPPGGSLDVRTRLQIAPQVPLLLTEASVILQDLQLPFGSGDGLSVAHTALQGGSFNLAANRLEVATLTYDGIDLRCSRNQAGHWSFLDRNYPLLARLAEPATLPPSARPASTAPPLSWRIGTLTLLARQLTLRDELPTEPTRFTVTDLKATVRDLAAPATTPASFKVQGQFQRHGGFQTSGTLLPSLPEVDATLQLQHIPLQAFAPYLREQFPVELADGRLDSRLSGKLRQVAGQWQGVLRGELGIGRFRLADAVHGEELLSWERLQLGGLDLRTTPPSVRIGGVALSNYYARLLIDEQARLNLAELFRRPPAAGDSPAEVPSLPAAAPPEVAIERITLQGGRVNFTDRHLPRPFTIDMLDLGGTVTGMRSTPGTTATVDLRGQLRNESPLTVSGTLNPLAKPLELDLALGLRDIELSPFSPYSGTYVGYLIERGKLNVDLAYQVANGRLDASNRLFIDQFTFGDKVDSPKATSLPVRLAVALLKDRNGEIHLDIPVWGNLDDPQFSVWRLVWQVVKNLLVKAATSPLALLGAFGGGGEDFSAVTFAPGSARLAEQEAAKLAKLAEAMRHRSELRIQVTGYIDPERDPEGYRREQLSTRLLRLRQLDPRQQAAMAAAGRDDNAPLSAEEYSANLWQLYRQAPFPKPRNVVGLVKHLPDDELEKLLLASIEVGEEQLQLLARQRAEAAIAALADSGLPRERLFIGTAAVAAPQREGLSPSRVEFGVVVK